MKYNLLLACLLCFQLSVMSQTPNVILIIADDLGVDYFNGYQNSNLLPTTPTLDSLRNSGVTFKNAWAAPKCTPTRATIMSGKHGVKTGVLGSPGNLDLEHRSLFNAIADSTDDAYAGAVIGKWHISQPDNALHPSEHGIDYYTGLLSAAVSDYYAWEHTHDGATTINTDYATKVLTDSAIKWVNEQEKPWFLWLAHVAPHGPFHVPPAGTYSIGNTDNSTRKYVAMIESMDYEINRLLNNIPSNELENTLIIMIGDNGTPNQVLQNYPNLRGKSTLYQGGVHVPMIVCGEGVTRIGEEENALVQVTDIHATILEATGADLPGGIYNSLSFKHLLDNSGGATRDYNYSEVIQNPLDQYVIRNERYKLMHSNLDDSEEFYDLQEDEFELNDLLLTGLSSLEQAAYDDLKTEATLRRDNWSCNDHIQNGDEEGIDCGGTFCAPCSTVGIDELNQQSKLIRIFPNPTQGKFNIVADMNNYGVRLSNIQGQEIITYQAKENKTILDIEHLSKGIYVISIFDENSQLVDVRKLVRK